MPPVVIDNPILNSPFIEPARHFRFDDDGITNEIAEGRRRSTYFIPIPKPRVKGGGQLALAGDFATEQARDNDFIPEPPRRNPVIVSRGRAPRRRGRSC